MSILSTIAPFALDLAGFLNVERADKVLHGVFFLSTGGGFANLFVEHHALGLFRPGVANQLAVADDITLKRENFQGRQDDAPLILRCAFLEITHGLVAFLLALG